jgi:hypothetical protein
VPGHQQRRRRKDAVHALTHQPINAVEAAGIQTCCRR